MENDELTPEEAHAEHEGGHPQELDSEQSRQWEENHLKIIDCIRKHMQSKYRTPTVTVIAQETGLSRPTIRKHMREFATEPDFREHANLYKMLTTDVLRLLYAQVTYGNMRAARLYLEIMGVLKYNAVVNNNFLYSAPATTPTVNEMEITQELIDSLNDASRDTIVDIIKRNK